MRYLLAIKNLLLSLSEERRLLWAVMLCTGIYLVFKFYFTR